MARARNLNRDKAFQLWKESDGSRLLKDIAEELVSLQTQLESGKRTTNG